MPDDEFAVRKFKALSLRVETFQLDESDERGQRLLSN